MIPKRSQFIVMLLIIIAVGVAVLIGGSVALHSQSEELTGIRTQVEAKNAERDKIESELTRKADLEAELANLEKQLASIDHELVNYKYIPTYLNQIQRATTATGNFLRRIQPTEPKPLNLSGTPLMPDTPGTDDLNIPEDPNLDNQKKEPEYLVQKISLDIQGDFVSALRLLDALRQFPKMVYVKSINLQPQGSDINPPVNIRLETYAIIIPDHWKTPEDEAAKPAGGTQ